MKLKSKLLLSQAPPFLAMLVLGIISLGTLNELSLSSQNILKDNYRSILAAQRMQEAVERIDSSALFVPAGRKEEGARTAAANFRVFEEELLIQEGNITERGEKEVTEKLRVLWSEYSAATARIFGKMTPSEATEYYFRTLLPLFLETKRQVGAILALNQDAIVRKSDAVANQAERMTVIVSVSACLAAAIGFYLSFTLITHILRPLSVLTQAARRFGRGDFAVRAVVEGEDEITALAREFNTMAHNVERYKNSSLGELLLAQNMVQAAIDAIPDYLLSFDAKGRLVSVNKAARKYLGIGFDPGASDQLSALDPALRDAVNRVRGEALSGGEQADQGGFEDAVKVDSGVGEIYLLPVAAPIFDDSGAFTGVAVILRDVSLLRKIDDLSKNLLATFAHEFRTPLTSLHMALHVCLEEAAGPLTEKQKELLHVAREDCEHLQAMVSDVLNLTRIQSGKLEMHRRRMSVAALVEHVFDEFRLVAGEKNVSLRKAVYLPAEEVFADPDRMEMVLSNFVSNAIRHSPENGKVEIRVGKTESGTEFEIADEGEGIAEEHLERIFEKFYRVPGKPGGVAGLGLSIARNIIEAHGGSVKVRSAPGEGTVFGFVIPDEV